MHMMSSSNGTFSALLDLAGNTQVTGEFRSQRPMTRSLDVFFHLRLKINDWVNNRKAGDLGRHCSLWYHCNDRNHIGHCMASCLIIKPAEISCRTTASVSICTMNNGHCWHIYPPKPIISMFVDVKNASQVEKLVRVSSKPIQNMYQMNAFLIVRMRVRLISCVLFLYIFCDNRL